ncbi:MAG: prepilin peptidase [Planctomycetaceae bacterium]
MTPIPDPAGPWALPAAACGGAAVGWMAAWAVGRVTDPLAGGRRPGRAALVVGLAAGAAALWWWEVVARGTLPAAAAAATVEALAWRWAGHVILLGFLAAAAWIDLRERVIPDAITLPGVLAGLAWSGLVPRSLPPVARAIPRSFAAPLFEPDVLGVGGPLGDAGLPAWLGSAPAAAGLAAGLSLFVGWWLSCTAPAERGPSGRRPFDPRLPALAAGLAVVGAAWWRGGDQWSAALSSLVGTAVGVAVVWSTRLAASRALGREAVGFGDVTLVAVIGAWLGWQGALLACCLGVLVGLVHGVVRFVLARDNELPFGPGLCVGAALVIVLWRPLWDRFGPAFARPLEIAAVAGLVIALTALVLAAWWRLRRGSAA